MIFEAVKNIIEDVLHLDEGTKITMESSFINDLNADSIEVVEMIMAIEEEFEVLIDDDSIEKIKNVGDIVSYLENLVEK